MQKALEGVILFQTDAEKGEGLELAKTYRVQGYPTFVMTDAGGEVLDTWSGYGKDFFLGRMAEAVADPTTMDVKRARFAANPTAADAVKIARYHATRGEHAEAVTKYEKAAALDPDADYAMELFDATFSGWREDAYTLDDVRTRADAVFAAPDRAAGDLAQVVDMMVYVGRKAEDPRIAVPYLKPALAAIDRSGDADLAGTRTSLEIQIAVLVDQDLDRAVDLKRASMPDGWKDDPRAINSFAWWCFETGTNLAEAETLARRGVELASPGEDRAMILDTAAEICNARGNCDDAVELMRLAVENAPDKEHYAKQLERFETIRAGKAN